MATRERTEDYERASLSTWATLAAETKGRDRYEDRDPLRTVFEQDRHRLLGSEALRRLGGKSERHDPQLPLATRLMRTLEVGELARGIARALGLNEDLVEAIALGHELGYPPFGVAGIEALTGFFDTPLDLGEQSVRVVETLERDGAGLNLTWETRDGILRHGWKAPEPGGRGGSDPPPPSPSTLEGQAVQLAARVCALLADLRDALATGHVSVRELPAPPSTFRSATVITDVAEVSLERPYVRLSPRVETAFAALAALLGERVWRRPAMRAETDRVVHFLRSLAVYELERAGGAGDGGRGVIDYVTALTDEAARLEFNRRFNPS